jgi:hypothetical protein
MLEIRACDLWQGKLDARLDREILALQNRDGSECAALSLRLPRLLENRSVFSLEGLAAHRLGEHPPFAPAPDFLSGRIVHNEVVRLTVGEMNLHHLLGVVDDLERELQRLVVVARTNDVERRGENFFFVGNLVL